MTYQQIDLSMSLLCTYVSRRFHALLCRCSSSQDVELQQRAVEYLVLSGMGPEAAGPIFATMPEWPERESSLLRRLRKGLPDDGASRFPFAPMDPM